MTRVFAITLALLALAAPLDAAAQNRGPRNDQDRGRPEQQQQREQPRRMSEAQAQSIAQSRAGGARFVGSRGLQGNSYVFVFDDGGRVFQVAVPAN